MKKIVTVFAAAVMAFALPTVGFAVESPAATQESATIGDVAVTVSGAENVVFDASKVPAKGTVGTPIANIYVEGDITGDEAVLTFNIGKEYAGYNATVYIEHSDGTTEVKPVVVDENGNIVISVKQLSIFSIVLGEPSGKAADSSAKSPSTSASLVAVAGLTAASTLGAGAVAVSLRKKDAE